MREIDTDFLIKYPIVCFIVSTLFTTLIFITIEEPLGYALGISIIFGFLAVITYAITLYLFSRTDNLKNNYITGFSLGIIVYSIILTILFLLSAGLDEFIATAVLIYLISIVNGSIAGLIVIYSKKKSELAIKITDNNSPIRFKDESGPDTSETKKVSFYTSNAGQDEILSDIESPVEEKNNILIKSAFTYKGATIQYKVKVENPTTEPIADIKVNLYVPDVFIVSESTKSISIIKPSESKTVTFDIRPTGECGDCEVSGKVVYYDYKTKETTETPIPSKNVSIVCPMLKSKEITESDWRNTLSGLTKTEENTKELDMPASTLFDVTTDVLQDMNLFMLDPKVNDSANLYRAVSKFYGEGVKSLKYAAQIEVVGGSSKAKLILKAWAESEDALTGFYHGILDEIEKRVHVKGLIDNTVVNNYHYGDNIGTEIKDSVVQRSNIGVNNDKCSGCGKERVQGEKFCMSCGTALG